MEYRKPSSTMTDIQRLERVGFSREQIAGLERVKERYQRETSQQPTAEDKRLAFIRWLYLQGRLES